MEEIGIFGGSFNPVHIGHMMIASFLAQCTPLSEVWLTLSPRNPKKAPGELADDDDRLAMLKIAANDATALSVCDVELSLPKPSYTINTLRHLKETYPDKQFRLIIGSDNWFIFNEWKESKAIIEEFGVIIYPRPEFPVSPESLPRNVVLAYVPELNISSTFIRKAIAEGIDVNYFLPAGVYKYIQEHELYK